MIYGFVDAIRCCGYTVLWRIYGSVDIWLCGYTVLWMIYCSMEDGVVDAIRFCGYTILWMMVLYMMYGFVEDGE